jgi:SPASM domain peptide maturase of grasp-with-spasm system
MEINELVHRIKTQLPRLPLSFRYLGALKEEQSCSNYHGLFYKPETVNILQTNGEPVGSFHKPIGRFITPVAMVSADRSESIGTGDNIEFAPVAIEGHKVFKLFSCCFPIKGASRSIICDIQRQHFSFIPNILFDILVNDSHLTFTELVSTYGEENAPVLQEYFEFLLEQEYGFWTTPEEAKYFSDVNLAWDSPLAITNSIVDLDEESNFDCSAIIRQLDALGCAGLQLRSFSPRPLSFFEDILSLIAGSRIKTVDIVLPWYENLTDADVTAFASRHPRINNLVIHGAPFSRFTADQNYNLTRIIYTTEQVSSEHHCGLVFADYFIVNMTMFTESHHFNSCLNRKISVDKTGFIKNCPSMQRDFGHISNTPLKAALADPAFTAVWNITKDQCTTCRDCEFRYICTDCRAYTQPDENGLGKPAHCQYDPYTATWAATPGFAVAEPTHHLHPTEP